MPLTNPLCRSIDPAFWRRELQREIARGCPNPAILAVIFERLDGMAGAW